MSLTIELSTLVAKFHGRVARFFQQQDNLAGLFQHIHTSQVARGLAERTQYEWHLMNRKTADPIFLTMVKKFKSLGTVSIWFCSWQNFGTPLKHGQQGGICRLSEKTQKLKEKEQQHDEDAESRKAGCRSPSRVWQSL